MRLGYHHHTVAYQNKKGEVFVSSIHGSYLEGISKYVKKLILYLHTVDLHNTSEQDYKITKNNIELYSLGRKHQIYIREFIFYRRINKGMFDDIDHLITRAPTPLLFMFWSIWNKEKPFSMMLVGDYKKSSLDMKAGFLKNKIFRLWASMYDYRQKKLARKVLVLPNNHLLFDEYISFSKQIKMIKTTTLTDMAFFERLDTCNNEIIHLLYVGRIDYSKGLEEMLQALLLLQQTTNNQKFVFNIVGWDPSRNGNCLKSLKKTIQASGLQNQVILHGRKKQGMELSRIYRNADIFYIGSKTSEGFPRVIWEAMASSLPVMASNVGGVPYYLTDKVNTLLLNQITKESIAAGISLLLEDLSLRQKIIKNGYLLSQDVTIEKQTKLLVKHLSEASV